MSHDPLSLMFAGVGGQGSLLMAELTSLAAVRAGYAAKQTEVHGVSQRGGSVETHVRFGTQIHSPIITPGQADFVVGLEKLEALRFAHYVNPDGGTLLVNDWEIAPASVVNAAEDYPHEAVDFLRGRGLRVLTLPATHIARDLGDGRMANVVMLGLLATLLPLPPAVWEETLRFRIPKRFLESNLKAFAAGQALPVLPGAGTPAVPA
jgi:indolepyruvate ferredoxin oxidoreductase beta subunit